MSVADVAEPNYNVAVPAEKPYTKVSVNFPNDLLTELDECAEQLPLDRSALIVRAVEKLMPTYKVQAAKVSKILDGDDVDEDDELDGRAPRGRRTKT